MARGRFVSYLRVSTARQGRSGLGLEAQRDAVRAHLAACNGKLAAEVVEIETGTRSDRPGLAEAVRLCRLHKATLVIAKLDRLARNVAFVSSLMESGVEFCACDFPSANRLTVHILAAVAEHEAKMISDRTKAALAAAKGRGTRLGGNRGVVFAPDNIAAGRAAIQSRVTARATELAPVIAELRASGVASLNGLAQGLTARGIPTAAGGATWKAQQVSRVLRHLP